jgi:hypothetical protein
MRRTAVEPGLFALGPERPCEFGRNDDILARLSPERAAEQLFIRERPVHFGGIPEIDAQFERTMKDPDGFRVIRLTVGPGHAHAAEAESRYLKPLFSEFSFLHYRFLQKIKIQNAKLKVKMVISLLTPNLKFKEKN